MMNAKEFINLHGKALVEAMLNDNPELKDSDYALILNGYFCAFDLEETVNLGQLREALKGVTVGSKVTFLGKKCEVIAEKDGTFWLQDELGRDFFKSRNMFTVL